MESGKREATLTYNLAIAKMAIEIQIEEAPTLHNIFVTPGSFHIAMVFFSVIGKYISESGGPHLQTESCIIENGSLTSFLLGKSYKKSKRIHQLLALAMEIQHFHSFNLSLQEDDLGKFISLEVDLPNVIDGDKKKFTAEHTNELIKKCEEFAQEKRNGKHGKTAKYWMGYVDMLHLYHEFSGSIRTGDLDLYIYCLQRMTVSFFTFNHQNYSRWFTVYHNKLLKLKNSHLDIYEEFKNGCFSLKRTSKLFSRIPIDLTLEQTINADAAYQRSGIILLTNSISARQRLAKNHSIRTSILSKLFEELRITRKEDTSKELNLHRVKKNCHHLEKIISSINDTMNPLASTIEKEHLFNIVNGKVALGEKAGFLTKVWTFGFSARDCFIKDCNDDPNAYQNPIKRQKIKNFASEAGSYKVSSKNKSLVSVSMTRDLFGSILYHVFQAEVDMEQILKYLLTPLPLSISHMSGTMQKNCFKSLKKELLQIHLQMST